MSYDLYVELGGNTQKEIDALVSGNHQGVKVSDIFERIRLLTAVAARNENVKDYAVSGDRRQGGGYKSLVHDAQPTNTPYAKCLIGPALNQFQGLRLIPIVPDLQALPPGSWFLQFTFTLARPWISKDDDPFYVTESVNPVRKDKVFKVPTMSAASWKGLLRWTAMHTRLVLQKDKLAADEFAKERFVQTLLFGDEKGEEPGKTKDFAAYLDALKPEARHDYERLLRAHYKLSSDDPFPHHSGRLMFYPTFFNRIDVEVINPHSRKTRAGTHPIYLECVPIGAQGTFSLLYVPFDLIGKEESDIKQQSLADLELIAEGLSAMFLSYGFSAKRTSGYGVAEDKIVEGEVKTRTGRHDLTGKKLSELPQEMKNVVFSETLITTLAPVLDALRHGMGDDLVAVVLFGSQARGEADSQSDWDLLVIACNLPPKALARHFYLKSMLPADWRACISLLAKTPQEFESRFPSLYLDIALDGIVLFDREEYMTRRLEWIRQQIQRHHLQRLRLDRDLMWYGPSPLSKLGWEGFA